MQRAAATSHGRTALGPNGWQNRPVLVVKRSSSNLDGREELKGTWDSAISWLSLLKLVVVLRQILKYLLNGFKAHFLFS